jgi:hypothetical protein
VGPGKEMSLNICIIHTDAKYGFEKNTPRVSPVIP